MAKSANMKVDTSAVDTSIKTIIEQGEKLENAYKSVFAALRSIDAAWDGDDNKEYNERFKNFEKDFLELSIFIEKTVNHLQLTANAYKNVESVNKKRAQKLSL